MIKMKKRYLGYFSIALVAVVILSRFLSPFTPAWVDVIFLIASVIFLVVVAISNKKE